MGQVCGRRAPPRPAAISLDAKEANATRIAPTLENKIATLVEENVLLKGKFEGLAVLLKGKIGALEAIIAEKADVEKADEASTFEKADADEKADEGFEKLPTTSSKPCALRPASFASVEEECVPVRLAGLRLAGLREAA